MQHVEKQNDQEYQEKYNRKYLWSRQIEQIERLTEKTSVTREKLGYLEAAAEIFSARVGEWVVEGAVARD